MCKKIKKITVIIFIIFFTFFNITLSKAKTPKINLLNKYKVFFNLEEFKAFYKIKYYKYVLLEEIKIIEKQKKENNKTISFFIRENELNKKIYGKKLSLKNKKLVNKIYNNILKEVNEIKQKRKIMNIFKTIRKIKNNTKSENIKNTIIHLEAKLALIF